MIPLPVFAEVRRSRMREGWIVHFKWPDPRRHVPMWASKFVRDEVAR